MHSVAVPRAVWGSSQVGKCAGQFPAPLVAGVDSIGYALDYVYRQVLGPAPSYLNRGVAVVNMSLNSGRLGFNGSGQGETNRAALMKLVTPSSFWVYEPARGGWVRVDHPGALFVQSAGNSSDSPNAIGYDPVGGRNLCTQFSVQSGMPSLAYTHAWPNNNTTSATDGVMVVGAMHHDGKAADRGAQPSAPLSGLFDSFGLQPLISAHSSNYGPCIDVWAPGNLIYSTWGDHFESNGFLTQVGRSYQANLTTGTSGWALLSGTSMAAPHVAGAAAWLADMYGLTTPAQIEQAVRQRFNLLFNGFLPIVDRAGSPINIVELP